MIPIMNEKEYVENIINSSTIPEKTSVNAVIIYLTKYYYPQFDNIADVIDAVCQQMDKFNLDIRDYQEYKCKLRVKRLCTAIANQKLDLLKEYESIPLYESEYNKIMSCESDKEKKILFTLYILARHTGKYGWVYTPKNEIFKLANVSVTNKGYKEIVYNLLQCGLIKNTKKVNDVKIGVNLAEQSEQIVFKVEKLKSLGNQFMAFVKPDYKLCECCDKLIKIPKKGRPPQYCNKCAYDIKLQQNNGYYHTKADN